MVPVESGHGDSQTISGGSSLSELLASPPSSEKQQPPPQSLTALGPSSGNNNTTSSTTDSPTSSAFTAKDSHMNTVPNMNGTMGASNGPVGVHPHPHNPHQNGNPNPNPNSRSPQNNATVKSCAGCGGRICDRFLLHALDRYWHTGCLKCSCCQAQLGEIGTSCFTKGDMILCKNDYVRLFGSSGTCSACGQSIPASEFVMKAQGNVYHLNCFACVTCHNRLVPGDRYSIVNGNVICEHDYPKVIKGHTQIPLRPSHKVC